jgi:hypothetical protein
MSHELTADQFQWLKKDMRWKNQLLYTILSNQEKQMAELDNLTANVAKLSADVDTLLAKPAPVAGVDPAAVQAQADAVAAIDAKVVAAIG